MRLPPLLNLDTVGSAWERLQGVLLLYFMGLLHATRQKTASCKSVCLKLPGRSLVRATAAARVHRAAGGGGSTLKP